MNNLIANLKRLWCKWFGHAWRIEIVEITSTYILRHDFCQRCGACENWQLEKGGAAARSKQTKERSTR